MGIGAKIKDALHGDHHTDTTTSTTSPNKSTPGSFPTDEIPQRHSDGKEYVAPHGSLIGRKDRTAGASTGPTSGLTGSGTHPNKLHKGGDEYDPAYETGNLNQGGHRPTDSGIGFDQASGRDHTGSKEGAYWGDLAPGQGGHGTNTGGLPDRSRLDDGSAATAGRHHGGTTGRHDAHVPGTATRDSRFNEDTTGTTGRHHDLRHGEQAVGGGVYNSVTGAGTSDYGGGHTGHSAGGHSAGVVHDPLTSGTKGIPVSSGHGNAYDQKTDLRGEGAPTSRNDHTGPGLAGIGTAAGAGAAAGYGAHEIGHHGRGNHQQTSSTGGNHPSGIPRSSMLDPEPGLGSSTSHQPGVASATSQPGFNSSASQPGFNNSASQPGFNNSTSPTIGHSYGSASNTHPGAGTSGSSPSPTTSSGGGDIGRRHFGPGHEGSKVLHTCQHCGRDNDISQYFSKDVVYRLGS